MSAPFLAAFAEQEQLQNGDPQVKGDLKIVRYRGEEAIFVQASPDRVTIIFSTVFKEETDKIYGRVFLQVRTDDWVWLMAGIRGCPPAPEPAERPSGAILEPRATARNPIRARVEEWGGLGLCHF